LGRRSAFAIFAAQGTATKAWGIRAGVREWACLMGLCGDIAERLIGRARSWEAIPRGFAWPGVAAVVLASVLASVLTGCTSNDGGELLIDPGRYAVYKCDDLAARWKIVSARERELHGLMDRAGQSNGGAVVGSLAYRADYDAVVSDERLLQRTAAEKNCGFTFQSGQLQSTQFQSDQTIR
jgi:hypothetical protein